MCTPFSASNRLDQIMLDEAHMVMTEPDCRVRLLGVRKILNYDRPAVFLTATLPCAMEQEFGHQPCLVMLATNALGAEVSPRGRTRIIFVGRPDGALSFHQADSRGGRNGESFRVSLYVTDIEVKAAE